MTDENQAAGETEATAKKERAKSTERYWCGPTPARDGAVYNRLQALVAANPGLNREDAIKMVIDSGFAAKNSAKFTENPSQFIGGYLTAGARKGYFTNDESKAVSAPNVAAAPKKEKADKGPTVTESGQAVLAAVRELSGGELSAGDGLPITQVAEKLGKNKTQLSRVVDKLVKDKFAEVSAVQDGDNSVDYIYVTEAGVTASAPAAAE